MQGLQKNQHLCFAIFFQFPSISFYLSFAKGNGPAWFPFSFSQYLWPGFTNLVRTRWFPGPLALQGLDNRLFSLILENRNKHIPFQTRLPAPFPSFSFWQQWGLTGTPDTTSSKRIFQWGLTEGNYGKPDASLFYRERSISSSAFALYLCGMRHFSKGFWKSIQSLSPSILLPEPLAHLHRGPEQLFGANVPED